jgi:hypothetical protein
MFWHHPDAPKDEGTQLGQAMELYRASVHNTPLLRHIDEWSCELLAALDLPDGLEEKTASSLKDSCMYQT